MNISGLNAGTPLAGPAGGPRAAERLDVTISEAGVQVGRPPASAAAAPGQITSDPALRQVLSADETQALEQQFAALIGRTVGDDNRIPPGGYNGRGAPRPAAPAAPRGSLVDFVG